MNGVVCNHGSSLGFESYVDKSYKKFQRRTQDLSNKICSISFPTKASDVEPIAKIVVTIENLKTQLRVMARCVEGVAIRHREATNSTTKISPRPKDFTPDIQKLKLINVACGVLESIAVKVDSIKEDFLSTPSPIDDYKELQVDKETEPKDVYSKKSWSTFSSMQRELIGLVSELENFVRHFFPSSGGERNYEKQWKYLEVSKNIEDHENWIANIRDAAELGNDRKEQKTISPRADSQTPNLRTLIKLKRASDEQKRIHSSLLEMREKLQTAQISEVLCAMEPHSPRSGFREKKRVVCDQMILLNNYLVQFKGLKEDSNDLEALLVLFGGQVNYTASLEYLEAMINAIQLRAERFSSIDRSRALNDFRGPTEKMFDEGLVGLEVCSQLQCKLLLKCDTIFETCDKVLSFEEDITCKPVFCDVFNNSLAEIQGLKFKTYPLLEGIVVEMMIDNDELIKQLTKDVREKFSDKKDYIASLELLSEFQSVCRPQLNAAVIELESSFESNDGDTDDYFRIFEELIKVHRVHHKKQQLVIASLRRFFY